MLELHLINDHAIYSPRLHLPNHTSNLYESLNFVNSKTTTVSEILQNYDTRFTSDTVLILIQDISAHYKI